MKYIQFFLSITILLYYPISVAAQTNNESDYLVLNNGDTLYGSVNHINNSGINPEYYKKIRFTDAQGKRKKYKKKDVSAFRRNNTKYEGFWLNQSSQKIVLVNPKYDIGTEDGERHFLKVISKGKLSHYEMEWWEQGESDVSWMYLLKKEDDQFLIRADQGILGLKRKTLAKYFSNCPDLRKQIEQKEVKQVREVVSFYNDNCAN